MYHIIKDTRNITKYNFYNNFKQILHHIIYHIYYRIHQLEGTLYFILLWLEMKMMLV